MRQSRLWWAWRRHAVRFFRGIPTHWSHGGQRAAWLVCMTTLAACSPQYDWREVQHDDGRYSISFPAKPDIASREVDLGEPFGPLRMTMQAVTVNDTTFAVAYVDLPRNLRLSDPKLKELSLTPPSLASPSQSAPLPQASVNQASSNQDLARQTQANQDTANQDAANQPAQLVRLRLKQSLLQNLGVAVADAQGFVALNAAEHKKYPGEYFAVHNAAGHVLKAYLTDKGGRVYQVVVLGRDQQNNQQRDQQQGQTAMENKAPSSPVSSATSSPPSSAFTELADQFLTTFTLY